MKNEEWRMGVTFSLVKSSLNEEWWMKNLQNEECRMKNEEYELVLYVWDTPLRPQAEECNLSSPKGGQEGALSQRT